MQPQHAQCQTYQNNGLEMTGHLQLWTYIVVR